jgi:hypothetical protein
MGRGVRRAGTHPRGGSIAPAVALALAGVMLMGGMGRAGSPPSPGTSVPLRTSVTGDASAVGNFSAAIDRLVELLGLAGSGLLSVVWARVALSWFSNDITKKVQAKDRARDALIGTLLFVAAITGLFWGLAHWVLTGS